MRTTSRTGAAVTTLAIVSATALTACGGGDSTPKAKDAWNKAQDTMAKQTSFQMTGSGKDDSGKPIHITAAGDTKGSAYRADLTQGSGQVKLISVGGKQYVNANAAYYQAQAGQASSDVAQKMANKWVLDSKTDNDAPLKDVAHDMQNDNDPVSKQLLSDKATVSTDTVNGQDAWKITGADKKSTAWVSKDGKYTLLKVQGFESADKKDRMGTITFSDYGKDFGIKPPAGAKSAAEVLGQ